MKRDAYELESFVFESRKAYEKAKKEEELIQTLLESADLTDEKNALKTYNRFVTDKTFSTIIGYTFLVQLRDYLIQSEFVSADALMEIPVKAINADASDTMPAKPQGESRYKRLYEIEKMSKKKFKIALIAAVVFLIGVIAVTLGSKYSVFTYFTNYKANMEEELIDKYENWQEELQQREDALEQK